jgi:predicted ferric reductase
MTQTSGSGLSGAALAFVYVVACTGATVIASALGMLPMNFGGALASASGITAIAMLLAQFVTSGRFESVSRRIGLDRTMGFHRVAAVGLILMVVLHVMALAARNTLDPVEILNRLSRLFQAPSARTGVVAFVILMLLVIWARSGRSSLTRYEIWRGAHGIGAIAAAGLAIHHFWRLGSIREASPLQLWLAGLVLIAAAAISIIYVLRPVTGYRTGATVDFVRRLNSNVIELGLRLPATTGFSFRAGQFAWLAFCGRHTLTDNPFSIASAPGELPLLRFLIREAGDTTKSLHALPQGTRVAIDGPHGSMVLGDHSGPVLLMAGGIGLAPILSIFRDLMASGGKRDVRLLAAAKTPSDHVTCEEISKQVREGRCSAIFLTERDNTAGFEAGTISAAHIERLLDGLDAAQVKGFLCGPPAMMDASVPMLLKAGILPVNLAMERFDYDAAGDPVYAGVRRRQMAAVAAAFAVTCGAALWSTF